jgi:hypothetical protein
MIDNLLALQIREESIDHRIDCMSIENALIA